MTNKEVTEKVTNRKALLVFWIGTVVREEYANKD